MEYGTELLSKRLQMKDAGLARNIPGGDGMDGMRQDSVSVCHELGKGAVAQEKSTMSFQNRRLWRSNI